VLLSPCLTFLPSQFRCENTNNVTCSCSSSIFLCAGPYHYLKGVQYGCSNAAQPEDIVLALQEDARFTSSFLSHCRAIPEPTKRAYLPVPFKQYNPDVVERGMPPGKPKNVDKKEHSKFTGFWAHTFHEYFCAYQLDVVNALSGPSKIQNTINIYELFLRKQIEPFSGVEPGLFKAYYPEHCEKPVKFETSQVCFRNKIEAMGSKPALGILYITEVIHQKKKHSWKCYVCLYYILFMFTQAT